MQMTKNKIATAIALFLMLTIAFSLVLLPIANAHDPPWQVESWAYLMVSPNTVGVGQNVYIFMWVDRPIPAAVVGNDVRRHNYELTITKPDNSTEKKTWDVVWDTTGVQSYIYTPNQVGTYKFVFHYPAQVYTWNATSAMRTWTKDTFKEATSRTVSLTVQQEPLPDPRTSYPLPAEYWTRPIEGQNTDWWKISSNWLGHATYGSPQIVDRYQPDGLAPNSPHIMWTKPIQDGGVVGGNYGLLIDGTMYYSGISYNRRFSNPIIMHGRLYYDVPFGNDRASGVVKCVDLRTGEEIWTNNYTSWTSDGFRGYVFSFGYLNDWDHYNQHGVIGEGWLFQRDFAMAVQPSTGVIARLNITNVPSGYEILGPAGEHLRYQWSLTGRWLAQWNSSKVFTLSTTGTVNASTASRYDWNVSVSTAIPTGATIRYALVDDILLFSNIATTWDGRYGTIDPYTVGAISLKPESRGNLLWMKNYTPPQPQINTVGLTRTWATADPVNRVIIFRDKETMVNHGYSMDDGSRLWTSTPVPNVPEWEYFSTGGFTAYGNFYYSGYGGIIYCWDTKTGHPKFTYGNGGPGNSTFSGLGTPWGLYPINIIAIADGKIYAATSEHSPNVPLYKDALIRCIDAFNGTEIWTLLGYDAAYPAVADGFLAYLNIYDMQIYSIGKGPSATTVSIQNDVTTHGNKVLVKGSVIDISAGTKQKEQAARFPNGVPAVSDASMKAWMEYVYMQKPRPTDATGVEVVVNVLDPNNNFYEVGRTTSDANGKFSLLFEPEVPGKYTVIATFAGSESYWPSHAETDIYVEEAPPATPPPQYPIPADYTLTIIGTGIAIIIAVAIATILLFRKRP